MEVRSENAFGLLDFNPNDVHLLTTSTTEGHVIVYLWGNFGWPGMPYAFDCVTRVLRTVIRQSVRGEADAYVYDVIGVLSRESWRSDVESASGVMTDLLGPDVEEPSKRGSTEESTGLSIDVIGWAIYLSSVENCRHRATQPAESTVAVYGSGCTCRCPRPLQGV